jgi:hypothetical protein
LHLNILQERGEGMMLREIKYRLGLQLSLIKPQSRNRIFDLFEKTKSPSQ